MVGGIGNSSGFDSSLVTQYRQVLFGRIDANGDGSIVKSELEAVAGNTASGPSIADIISALDSEGDGAISKSESDAALDQRMSIGDFPANLNLAGGSGRLNNSSVSGADDFFGAVDTNGDDMIDATEMETFLTENGMEFDQAIFDSIDTDGDGSITRTEMEAMRANMAPPPPPPPPEDGESSGMSDELFSAIDTNGDDLIDTTEMETFLTGNGMEFDQAIFDSIDTYGDGAISRTESDTAARSNMQAQMPPPPPPASTEEDDEDSTTINTLFSSIDTNGDGVIDKSELEAYMEDTMAGTSGSLIEDLDTDGDGKISATEAETARLKIQESFHEELLSNGSTFKFQNEQMLEAYASIIGGVPDGDAGGSISLTA